MVLLMSSRRGPRTSAAAAVEELSLSELYASFVVANTGLKINEICMYYIHRWQTPYFSDASAIIRYFAIIATNGVERGLLKERLLIDKRHCVNSEKLNN